MRNIRGDAERQYISAFNAANIAGHRERYVTKEMKFGIKRKYQPRCTQLSCIEVESMFRCIILLDSTQ